MNETADRHGFVVYPGQPRRRNAWGSGTGSSPRTNSEGRGPGVLAAIARRLLAEGCKQRVDPAQAFVAGLSSGGTLLGRGREPIARRPRSSRARGRTPSTIRSVSSMAPPTVRSRRERPAAYASPGKRGHREHQWIGASLRPRSADDNYVGQRRGRGHVPLQREVIDFERERV